MSPTRRKLLSACLVAAAALVSERGIADKRELTHEALRRAVEKGEVRPLTDIIAGLRGKLPGDIVGVEVEDKDGRWIYEFRVISSKGQLFDVYVDAASGSIQRIKEK